MLWMLVALLLSRPRTVEPQIYSAWAETGYHLMISDNGTPDHPEDDWVVDREDNREFKVTY